MTTDAAANGRISIAEFLNDNDLMLNDDEIVWRLTKTTLEKQYYHGQRSDMYSVFCQEVDGDMVYAMNTGHTIRVFKCQCATCNNVVLEFEGTSLRLQYDTNA